MRRVVSLSSRVGGSTRHLEAVLRSAHEGAGVSGDGEPLEALLEARFDVVSVGGNTGGHALRDACLERPIDVALRRLTVAECLTEVALPNERGVDAGDAQDALDVIDRLRVLDHRHS